MKHRLRKINLSSVCSFTATSRSMPPAVGLTCADSADDRAGDPAAPARTRSSADGRGSRPSDGGRGTSPSAITLRQLAHPLFQHVAAGDDLALMRRPGAEPAAQRPTAEISRPTRPPRRARPCPRCAPDAAIPARRTATPPADWRSISRPLRLFVIGEKVKPDASNALSRTIRAAGWPSGVAVASVIAFGSGNWPPTLARTTFSKLTDRIGIHVRLRQPSRRYSLRILAICIVILLDCYRRSFAGPFLSWYFVSSSAQKPTYELSTRRGATCRASELVRK